MDAFSLNYDWYSHNYSLRLIEFQNLLVKLLIRISDEIFYSNLDNQIKIYAVN